ncbi:MAG TPA: MerR family transcriptional regulator [Streptosporangiaceae bacterium]|nr:MerR family transcriptional regulator [Streptosporangiaceae bacterium]
MTTLLAIGDFSRMTHLSVKALRHYHDMGVLEPAAIDPDTGYRSYATAQVPDAQVIRRLRDLNMPLDQIRAVLHAPDVGTRNAEIAAHLERMERQLEQAKASVAGLRALLAGPVTPAKIELRTIPAMTALAVTEIVNASDAHEWGAAAYAQLTAALAATGLAMAGSAGALFPSAYFELERSEITLFFPVLVPDGAMLPALPPGPVRWQEIPATEVAVMVHEGGAADVDRTYGALGTAVAERAIGVEGPIREYYVVGWAHSQDERDHRTEVCWPVFRTAGE